MSRASLAVGLCRLVRSAVGVKHAARAVALLEPVLPVAV
jgi:hypothetical protein